MELSSRFSVPVAVNLGSLGFGYDYPEEVAFAFPNARCFLRIIIIALVFLLRIHPAYLKDHYVLIRTSIGHRSEQQRTISEQL